jgi:hypothetical protein
MAAKKKPRRKKRITGLEASLLSFHARYGDNPPQYREVEEHLSPHVRKILSAPKKSKAARKTLSEIRRVADENRKFVARSWKSRSDPLSPRI